MEIVFATSNKNKLKEISHKFSEYTDISFVPLSEIAGEIDIPETGTTFEENAFIKARTACKITGRPAAADDSGLEVDALHGEPGGFSARYGNLSTDNDRNTLLLSRMENVADNYRTARFVSVIALVFPDGREFSVRGTCEGSITRSPAGTFGFGYDPVFYIKEYNATMAQLSLDRKNTISHRAHALDKFRDMVMSIIHEGTK